MKWQLSLLFNVFIVRTVCTQILRHLQQRFIWIHMHNSGWNEIPMNIFPMWNGNQFSSPQFNFLCFYVSDIEYSGINVNNTAAELIKISMNGPKTMCTYTNIILCYIYELVYRQDCAMICDMKVKFWNTQQMGRRAFINCLILYDDGWANRENIYLER